MTTLAVLPSLPAHYVAPGQVLLTRKFVEGMSQYAALWDGPVVAVMHPSHGHSTGNLDEEVFDTAALPFEVRIAVFGSAEVTAALADAGIVMLGGDHRLTSLPAWCKERGKKTVFVTEYSLRTRLQIVAAETSNPALRWRRYVWEWQQERRNRRGVATADAVQCNGTPTYDEYRELNANSLLFLDSRVNATMLTDSSTLAKRHERLMAEPGIRLAYSGRLNEIKGVPDLVEVARLLQAEGLSFRLDIFGDGPLRHQLESKFAAHNLDDRVHLHGVVDFATELLPFVAREVDLFVCCHRQGDPSCTYLETFACGVPVVGYANEALSGLTRSRAVGWTVPINQPAALAQKIVELSGARREICEAGNTALLFARRHTFEREFGARIDQIRKLLDSGTVGRPDRLEIPWQEIAGERLRSAAARLRAGRWRAQAIRRPFGRARRRLLLVTEPERIPQSQIFPFHFYADELRRRYDVAIREVDLQTILERPSSADGDATTVAFQTPFDIADEQLDCLTDRLHTANPNARMVYLDWSAPADLRNAARLDPHIDLYVKKHVLRNREQYGQPTLGDTNLADYYARRFGLPEGEYRFAIPAGFMDKLMVGPSFATAPLILPALRQPFRPISEQPIDLHARFAVDGTPWYQAMRGEAAAALDDLGDLRLAVGNTLPLYRFIAELRRSKICFSPFGYGEVCWRDYEAVMAGSVLLKPDMSHIETNPDIFRPWETYVPLRWDLTDLEATVRRLLGDADLRHRIAAAAHAVLNDYLCSDGFVTQVAPLFDDRQA